jgi:glycosyltransferase involved in cell wall biosynthesis
MKPDVVHCHNTFPLVSPSAYYAAIHCRVPVIQTIHNYRFLCPEGMFFCDGHVCELCRENRTFRGALRNKCYRGSRLQTMIVAAMLKLHRFLGTYRKIDYIFLTEFNRSKFDRLIDIQGANVFVKPNFVNAEMPERHRMENKVFVFAGRLEENKGIHLLLDRWRLLPEDCELHIYGDGTLKEKVAKAAAEQGNVSFFGFRPQADVFEDLKSAVGLIFPSLWYEGFPMVVAESMAMGCPVLATNLGNHGDIVRQSQGGVLFEPDSEESFMDAVNQMISENERLSENAGSYYETVLNKDSNYKALEEIYRAVAAGT